MDLNFVKLDHNTMQGDYNERTIKISPSTMNEPALIHSPTTIAVGGGETTSPTTQYIGTWWELGQMPPRSAAHNMVPLEHHISIILWKPEGTQNVTIPAYITSLFFSSPSSPCYQGKPSPLDARVHKGHCWAEHQTGGHPAEMSLPNIHEHTTSSELSVVTVQLDESWDLWTQTRGGNRR